MAGATNKYKEPEKIRQTILKTEDVTEDITCEPNEDFFTEEDRLEWAQ